MRMSTRTVSMMAGCLFAVGVVAGVIGGCSSSGSSDYVGICEQLCNKEISCLGDASAGLGLSASVCMSECMSQANTANCPNASQVAAGAQACLGKSDCTQFMACVDAAPQCTSGGATGGTSGTGTGGTTGSAGHAGGTGGTTGGAGSGGTADCSVCTTFVSSGCCAALATKEGQSSASCSQIAAACTASPSSTVSSCQAGMSAGAALSVAGCS